MFTQFFGNETIKKLEKTSSTVVTLPAGSKIKLGGKGSKLTSALILSTAILGAGGMESAIAISTLYYVYVVNDAGVEKLIATTSEIKPSNFNAYKKVGAFYTDGSSNIFKAHYIGFIVKTVSQIFANSANTILSDIDDILVGISTVATGIKEFTMKTGEFSVVPGVYSIQEDTNASGAFTSRMIGTPTTTIIRVENWGSGALLESEFYHVNVTRKGIDAVQPDWNNY